MTTLKMIIAVVGTLVFLGLFSVAAHHQGITSKTCTSKSDFQEMYSINFTCLATKNTQANKKG